MKTFKKTEILYDELIGRTCDKCGCDLLADAFEDQESLSVVHWCGYGSIWGDGNRIEVDLCQQCVDKLLGDIIRVYDVE